MDSGDDFQVTIVLNDISDINEQPDLYSLHQCLLMLFDSPLNHANYLQVYIKLNTTNKQNSLIRVHRETRIPRTVKRFSQLLINFLNGEEMPKVQTRTGLTQLLQFVSSSMLKSIESNRKSVRVANLAPSVKTCDYLTNLSDENKNGILIYVDFGPVDFNILGDTQAMEYELVKIAPKEVANVDPGVESIAISNYPISSSLAIVKICSEFEKALDIY